MTRTEFLRNITIDSKNKTARTNMPKEWSVADMDCSISERRAYAVTKILENMPLYIGEKELIVGTRTMLSALEGNEDGKDISAYDLQALPKYINDSDIDFFGFNQQSLETHSTAGYDIILKQGIDGIINKVELRLREEKIDEKISFLKSVIIGYKGLATLIERYAQYANELYIIETDLSRKDDLLKISNDCKHIAKYPAETFSQACQLLWFAHLAVIIENFTFMNYGRVDQILYPYLNDMPIEEAQQYIDCLLLKMYDDDDLKISYLGNYSAQANLTIGGITIDGEDAINPVTYMLIQGKKATSLPDPQYAIRIHSKNPTKYVDEVCELAVMGINCVAYYNDDLWIDSLVKAGVEKKYANDYSFDLCQDITVAGKADFCTSGSISLAFILMDYLKEMAAEENTDWICFFNGFKSIIAKEIKSGIENYNKTLISFIDYNNGNKTQYIDKVKLGEVGKGLGWGKSLMAPTPITSALFHGCIESATDLTRMGCEVKDKGFYLMTPTQTINSLSAIKHIVYDKKIATLKQIYEACVDNFEKEENKILRAQLLNAPKWGNDDDRVDLIAKELYEFACSEVTKYDTPDGGKHLAGIHQAHPVGTGHDLMATPDGRKSGTPVPVTLTPSSGTMKNGPTAALKSATKIDPMVYQWNFCIMLQYFSSVFEGNDGVLKFKNLLLSYFKMGGKQHQPNVMNVEDLKRAQLQPEKYKDLIVRLWGVSAHFVDLPKELQEEVISRFD